MDFVNGKDDIPFMKWKIIQSCSKPPTSHDIPFLMVMYKSLLNPIKSLFVAGSSHHQPTNRIPTIPTTKLWLRGSASSPFASFCMTTSCQLNCCATVKLHDLNLGQWSSNKLVLSYNRDSNKNPCGSMTYDSSYAQGSHKK